MRASYNGSTGVSKTSSVGSIPTARAWTFLCKMTRKPSIFEF